MNLLIRSDHRNRDADRLGCVTSVKSASYISCSRWLGILLTFFVSGRGQIPSGGCDLDAAAALLPVKKMGTQGFRAGGLANGKGARRRPFVSLLELTPALLRL